MYILKLLRLNTYKDHFVSLWMDGAHKKEIIFRHSTAKTIRIEKKK